MNHFSITADIPAAPDRVWSVLADVERWPGGRAIAEHGVEPVERGSRVTLSVRFEGLLASLVSRLTRDLNRRYLELEAAGLRARSISPQWRHA